MFLLYNILIVYLLNYIFTNLFDLHLKIKIAVICRCINESCQIFTLLLLYRGRSSPKQKQTKPKDILKFSLQPVNCEVETELQRRVKE